MNMREMHDGRVVVHSSIALLQERFRELQRVKAMREEREILRMEALSHQPKQCQYLRLFFHPDQDDDDYHHHHHLVLPQYHHESASGVSLSLWPTLQMKHDHDQDYTYRNKKRKRSIEMKPLLINLCPTVTDSDKLNTSCSNKLQDYSDCDSDHVDTSLHL